MLRLTVGRPSGPKNSALIRQTWVMTRLEAEIAMVTLREFPVTRIVHAPWWSWQSLPLDRFRKRATPVDS